MKTISKTSEKVELLYNICNSIAPFYHSLKDPKLKEYLDVMIGAQIFYLGSSKNFFNKISKNALEELEQKMEGGMSRSMALSKLTKEHQYPRKISAMKLMDLFQGQKPSFSIFKDHLYEFLTWNYVTRAENNLLKPFQKLGVFSNPVSCYQLANIELFDFDL